MNCQQTKPICLSETCTNLKSFKKLTMYGCTFKCEFTGDFSFFSVILVWVLLLLGLPQFSIKCWNKFSKNIFSLTSKALFSYLVHIHVLSLLQNQSQLLTAIARIKEHLLRTPATVWIHRIEEYVELKGTYNGCFYRCSLMHSLAVGIKAELE